MSKMKAFKVKVSGKVQRVGYRRYALEEGRRLKLTGYVINEPDDTVTIFVQGPSDLIDAFISVIKRPPLPAVVDEVKRQEVEVDPEIKHFEMKYGLIGEELQEGFGTMQSVFINYWKEFAVFAGKTDESFKFVLGRYGQISEKLTVILETLTRESKETRKELTETVNLLKQAVEKISK